MNELSQIFALLSEAMLIPVLVALLVVFAAMIVSLGGHAVEGLERWRDHKRSAAALAAVQRSPAEERGAGLQVLLDDRGYHGNLARFLAAARARPDRRGLAQALDEVEAVVDRRLARALLLQRLGPLLGLMGTLIPMGPALAALAAGDIRDMATRLILAFTTTVIGLAIAAIGTIIASARRRWYAADLRLLEAIADLTADGEPDVGA